MSITNIQNQIIEEFSVFDEWMDKYEYLIELGKSLAPLNPKYKTDAYLIQGCQSKVWLHAELNADKVTFQADGDTVITKGIVALLVRVLNNHTPSEIISEKLFFLEKIGLQENLSPTRSNGLLAMIKQMKMYALAFEAKLSKK